MIIRKQYNHTMVQKTQIKEKRKTYSLDPEKSRMLARASIAMEGELRRTVPRQSILDALVECISEDKEVFKKVLRIIQ